MASIPNGVETLPKISSAWVRVHERYRQTTDGRHIANVNFWTWVYLR